MPSPAEPSPSPGPDGGPGRFSWQGAPGYSPVDPDRVVPHQPMPGAPPYPAATEHPPPPVGDTATGTRIGRPLLAAAGCGVVNVVLVLVVAGMPPTAGAAAAVLAMIVGSVVVAGGLTWLVARRRAWAFWALLLVAALFFWVLRAATTSGIA